MDRKITALKAQKRDRNRISVFLDGEFAFGLSRIVAAWLQVGQTLNDEKIIELKDQDARESAYQQALRWIETRDRSIAEIQRNLQQRGISEEIISEVMARLQRSGLIDDSRFARLWVENRNEFRPRGRRALTYELRGKGIDQSAVEDVLADFDDGAAAYDAAHRYTRKIQQLPWLEFKRKLFGHLARRGFNYETAKEAIARVWAELKEEDSAENTTLDEEVDQ